MAKMQVGPVVRAAIEARKGHPATSAQLQALENVAWANERWWHDIPAGTRDVLLRRGWIREVRRERCNTRGHRHPGYVGVTDAGLWLLGGQWLLLLTGREDGYAIREAGADASSSERVWHRVYRPDGGHVGTYSTRKAATDAVSKDKKRRLTDAGRSRATKKER